MTNETTFEQRLKLGHEYREDFTFDLYGEEVTVYVRMLVDPEFLPLVGALAEHLDIDGEEVEAEAVEEAVDETEGEIDMAELDDEFVRIMQEAAVLGIEGGYDEDGEKVEFSKEKSRELVSKMIGGASVELGGRILELSGDARDAEKFR